MPRKGKKGVRQNKGNLSNEWDELASTGAKALELTKALQANTKVLSESTKNIVAMHVSEPLEGVTTEQLTAMVGQARTINEDVTRYSGEVIEIAKGHEGKTGGLRSQDQQFELFGHAQKYHDATNNAIDLAAGDMGDLFVSISEIAEKNPGREIKSEELAAVQSHIERVKEVKQNKDTH